MSKIIFLALLCIGICSSCIPSIENQNELPYKMFSESFQEAKISFPGLGCNEDTFAIQILIPRKDIGYNELLLTDTSEIYWKLFILNISKNVPFYKDTILRSGKGGKGDTLVIRSHFEPKPIYRDSIFIDLLSGFRGLQVQIYSNEKPLINFPRKRYKSISKLEIDSIGISLDNHPIKYFEIDKRYNAIHLIKLDDEIIVRQVYLF